MNSPPPSIWDLVRASISGCRISWQTASDVHNRTSGTASRLLFGQVPKTRRKGFGQLDLDGYLGIGYGRRSGNRGLATPGLTWISLEGIMP